MNDPIRHVVVLMLENNSFDRMLGCMKGLYPDLEGVDAAMEPLTNPDFPDPTHLFGQLRVALQFHRRGAMACSADATDSSGVAGIRMLASAIRKMFIG